MIIFIFSLIGLNFLITTYFYQISVRNHKLFKQDKAFFEGGNDISFLIMGHSKPAAAIDFSNFKNASNFCSGGEASVYTYYKLKHIFEKSEKNITTVVLPAGFLSFCIPDPKLSTNSFYWKKYVDFLELGRISNETETYRSIWIKSKLVPWYEFFYLKLLLNFGDVKMGNGKISYTELDDSEKLVLSEKVITRSLESKIYYDQTAYIYLKKTIKLCQKHGCEMVFVKYPISQHYREVKNTHLAKGKLKKKYRKFNEYIKSQDGIRYFDFQDLYLGKDYLFKDPQHLNSEGRKLFTAYFKSVLMKN